MGNRGASGHAQSLAVVREIGPRVCSGSPILMGNARRLAVRPLLVVVAIAMLSACDDGGRSPRASVGAEWGSTGEQVPPVITDDSTFGWSGSQALVAGGQSWRGGRSEFALFDPAQDRWSKVSEPPFEHPLFSPTVAWVGDLFVVVGVECAESNGGDTGILCTPGTVTSATYRPDVDRWESAEEIAGDFVTELQLELHTTDDFRAVVQAGDQLLIFDSKNGSWTSVPRAIFFESDLCLADGELLSAGGDHGPEPPPTVHWMDLATGVWSEPVELGTSGDVLWDYACGPDGLWVFESSVDRASVSAWEFGAGHTFEPRPAPVAMAGYTVSDRSKEAFVVKTGKGPFALYRPADGSWTLTETPFLSVHSIALIDSTSVLVIASPGSDNYQLAEVALS